MILDFSVQSLRSLCLCGGFTTETQRTQRLHREASITYLQPPHSLLR